MCRAGVGCPVARARPSRSHGPDRSGAVAPPSRRASLHRAPAPARPLYPLPPRRRGGAAGAGLLDPAPLGGAMIIGTAGHIDHGKSALLAALTGRHMDRLAEERRRGITIDLNFAPLELGGGIVAGVVDVPGHEDFVRTMVAGASGFDVALLIIAADEGIMPQTEEHLAILEQLGIRSGVPVVTKADLVEPDWLDLVVAEVAQRLARSSVAFDPPVAASAVTGQGLEELRGRLLQHASSLGPRSRDDGFRLPIDRAFSVAGVGTVVTGTAWSGSVAVGDAVRLVPGEREGRVRSLESHGRPVERTEPG